MIPEIIEEMKELNRLLDPKGQAWADEEKERREEGMGRKKSIRIDFEKAFGVDQAKAIYDAALSHEKGVNNIEKGSDPFKWALLIAIGYQCMEVERYREHHGITAPWEELKAWIKEHADLSSHNGDCDYLALFAGKYNEYVGKEELCSDTL
jgi:hypothetical protein